MILSNSSSRSYEAAFQKTKAYQVLIRSNIGGYFFDAIFKNEHTSNLKITDFPVQSGAALTDYAYMQPTILIMDIGMSDTAKPIDKTQFTGGDSRSKKAYEVLLELQRSRVPLQVTTRLKVYQNMLIESIVVPDDFKTQNALKATVTLREIQVATVKTIRISARPHVTNSTKKGTQEPVNPNQSVLKQIGDKISGKKTKK